MEKETQQCRPSPSALQRIQMALGQTCLLRGAKLDKPTLLLYSQRLAKEPTEDVVSALEALGDLPRAEGEMSLPEIGAILKLVEVERLARINRTKVAAERKMVCWGCPACGGRMTGFLAPGESTDRACPSPYRPRGVFPRSLPTNETCGAIMRVTDDDRRRPGERYPYRDQD